MSRILFVCGMIVIGICLPATAADRQEPSKPAANRTPDDPFGAGARPAKTETSKPSRKLSPKNPCAPPAEHASGTAAIEAALQKPIQLEVVQTPLFDVVDYLRDRLKIEIQLDKVSLESENIGHCTMVTFKCSSMPAESALGLILEDLGLHWTIDKDVLLITTKQHVETLVATKVYDVADLVACHDNEGKPWNDYDTLVNMITTTVSPTTWKQAGGQGDIVGASLGKARVLVITHDYHTHRKIAALLKDLRAVAAQNAGESLPVKEPQPANRSATSEKNESRGFFSVPTK